MPNVLNYTEQGGAKTVIGGELDVNGTLDVTGATITGFPEAAADTEGTVKMAANIADSEEVTAPTTAEFNALLAALKAAGLMVDDE